jgi:hypothetical protein
VRDKASFLVALALALVATVLCCFSRPAAAAPPYEPNDSLSTASGPLELGQTYTAAIETGADRDFFFFYVISSGPTQISLAAQNLGGDKSLSGVNAAILDASATPLQSLPYLGDGESRTATIALEPQKYFVEVTPNEGSGDAYALAVSGSEGAVGPYGQIAERCASAGRRTDAAQTGLTRAEAKLQHARARLSGSRHGTAAARKAARVVFRKARASAREMVRKLKAARQSREPWCSISQ